MSVSFLLATGSPRTSEPGSPEEAPAHTDTSGGEGTTHRSQYGTHVFKPELNRDVHNSVYSGNVLAIVSVDSYAYEET